MLAVSQHLSLSEIEANLNHLGASPQDNGTVALIVCRPAEGERTILETAKIDLEKGVVGDNWQARGSRHTEDGRAHPDMQIAIMNSRVIHALTNDQSRWSLAGDQLFLDLDFSEENLPVGQRLQIGTAILEVSPVPHNGCAKFTERFGSDATKFVNSIEGRQQRRRGVNTRIVQAGIISTGDRVTKL